MKETYKASSFSSLLEWHIGLISLSLSLSLCVCVCVRRRNGDENTEPNYPFNESDTFRLALFYKIFPTLKQCSHTERAFEWGFLFELVWECVSVCSGVYRVTHTLIHTCKSSVVAPPLCQRCDLRSAQLY